MLWCASQLTPAADYFAVILRQYLATGRALRGVAGRAGSELIEAADVVAFGVGWMAEHLVEVVDGQYFPNPGVMVEDRLP